MNDTVRIAVAGALVWYALNMDATPAPTPGGGGSGTPVPGVEQMEAADREGLAEALDAIATIVEDDRLKSMKTTQDAKDAVETMLSFGYSAFQLKTYPAVGSEIQNSLAKAVGEDVKPLDDATRREVVTTLRDLSKGVR